VGAVLFAGSTGIAFGRAGSISILIAFGVLALLVLAVVSSTQADIAAVIAVVALMGVTPMSEVKPNELKPVAGHGLLVALGDSYMSGEGAQIFYKEGADEGKKGSPNQCHRAPTAWAAMAGQTKLLFNSVAMLACSGADTYNVRHQGTVKEGERSNIQGNEPGTQLDQVDLLEKELGVKELDPSLVVVSLGGNNAGFSTIGAMCIAPGDCSDKADLWEKTLDQVSRELTSTYQEIRTEFPNAPVLVTAYPIPIFTNTPGTAVKCGQVALSDKDQEFISSFLPKLNATVKEAALKEGFYFLDKMADALEQAHLQLCDPENDGRPGVNFIGLRSVAGIAEQRFNPQNWYHNSLHPNARGHAAMLEVFEEWMAQNPKLGTTKPVPVEAKTSSDANEAPLCDLNPVKKSGTPGCRDLGTKWALGQVSDKLLKDLWLIQFALAAVGAWLLGVAFYAWWKPWWKPQLKPTSPGHPLPHPTKDPPSSP
jgi:lysophospholipase L1-like esterase